MSSSSSAHSESVQGRDSTDASESDSTSELEDVASGRSLIDEDGCNVFLFNRFLVFCCANDSLSASKYRRISSNRSLKVRNGKAIVERTGLMQDY